MLCDIQCAWCFYHTHPHSNGCVNWRLNIFPLFNLWTGWVQINLPMYAGQPALFLLSHSLCEQCLEPENIHNSWIRSVLSSFRFIAYFVSTWNPHLHLFPVCLQAHHICPFSSLVCNALCHSFTASWGCLSVYASVSSCFTVWTLVFAGICIFLRLETLNCSSLSLCESFSRTHPIGDDPHKGQSIYLSPELNLVSDATGLVNLQL